MLAAAGNEDARGREALASFARSIGIRFTPSFAGKVTVRTMPRT